ncbi:MAG: phosphonate C-P lyase system protein PhnH [Alphaproteobacteria bacterium]|nr:phosphonate C-P lyase system protein PhnH [Alphaproteobacteria bacterium]
MAVTGPRPGFTAPVLACQQTFRSLLTAIAHPGRVMAVGTPLDPPLPLGLASAAILLTLADMETPIWLGGAGEEAAQFLQFHSGAPIAKERAQAVFAFVARASDLPPLVHFNAGSDASPERSATLIIEVDGLVAGQGRRLAGPGIEGETRLDVAGLDGGFWDAWRRNGARFPMGVDVIFTAGDRLAALPRTTIERS